MYISTVDKIGVLILRETWISVRSLNFIVLCNVGKMLVVRLITIKIG